MPSAFSTCKARAQDVSAGKWTNSRSERHKLAGAAVRMRSITATWLVISISLDTEDMGDAGCGGNGL
jgi:hypothetical protein